MEYKGYKIIGDGTYGQKVIKNIGPGTIPRNLSGSFTNDAEAIRAIDRYVGAKEVEDVRIKAVRDARPTTPKLKEVKKR